MDHLAKGWGCQITGVNPLVNSAVFNVEYYLNRYPDLAAAFGNDYAAAINHWLTSGIAEGRQGAPGFNSVIYLNRNTDVQAAFGAGNYRAAIEHYIQYGISEGRAGN